MEQYIQDAGAVFQNLCGGSPFQRAECAAQGITFNANEAVAGAVYEMVNGTGTAKDFYEPVSTYEKGIIKEKGKQDRRTAWNQGAVDVVSGLGKAVGKLGLKALLK